MPHFSQVQNEY